MLQLTLSEEQEQFIEKALCGHNILVDACIGSGKTTSIQQLCSRYPASYKILYLTYNRLLKIDAKSRIIQNNVTVTNYHGFASSTLRKDGKAVGVPDLIREFNRCKPPFPIYDVLLIDEYQDIDQELSEMLEIIKSTNSQMQIIAVGDMEQKIYDSTALDVKRFIDYFLGDYLKIRFTRCFRLNKEFAATLGRVWKKPIEGVNNECEILHLPSNEITDFLNQYSPKDILCLGSRNGIMTDILNDLEKKHGDKFNKNTVFASIADYDSIGSSVTPKADDAIFTSFDSSKGLERRICVLADFTERCWSGRSKSPTMAYEILRNIFCVAASRGKEKIVFVDDGDLLSEKTLSSPFITKRVEHEIISQMFDFKYNESVEYCYSLISKERIEVDNTDAITICSHDGLIDLSPCIGNYQEASYFNNYDIDKILRFFQKHYKYDNSVYSLSTEEKILLLTAHETGQNRYKNQVRVPFVKNNEKELLRARLAEVFSKDETVQVDCKLVLRPNTENEFTVFGFADVVKDDVVYELKYVSELSHKHFLQCACYVVALNLQEGILWNTRDNSKYRITIPDRNAFIDAVATTVLKEKVLHTKKGAHPNAQDVCEYSKSHVTVLSQEKRETDTKDIKRDYISVIDVETTFSGAVMSIGVVIADAIELTLQKSKYYIISDYQNEGGLFSNRLWDSYETKPIVRSLNDVMDEISKMLQFYGVTAVFAYNAAFDKKHLPDLGVRWYDIAKIAAYKQYNKKLPPDEKYCATGRLKRYGLEHIMRLMTKDNSYCETHNAIIDAMDELKIMRMLELPIDVFYSHAVLQVRALNKKAVNDYQRTIDEVKCQRNVAKSRKMMPTAECNTNEVSAVDKKDPDDSEAVIDSNEQRFEKNINQDLSDIEIHSFNDLNTRFTSEWIAKKDHKRKISRKHRIGQIITIVLSVGLAITLFLYVLFLIILPIKLMYP